MIGPATPTDLRTYVRAVIDAYVSLPATPARARREDRHLAGELYRRSVPLETVQAALLLATSRRIHRPARTSPLSTIRSLHYFLPVIEEVLRDPPQAAYLDYLRDLLAETLEPSPPSTKQLEGSQPAPVQKTTFLHER